MEEKRKAKKGKNFLWVWVVCFAVIAGAIALLLYSVLNQKETRTSTEKQQGEMGVLECKTSMAKDPFFAAEGELKGTHKIKVMMRDEKANEVAYEYEGKFESQERARTAESTMHADYNIYMKEEAEKLTPVFGATDGTVRISLYASGGKLNSVNAKVFFLTTDEMMEFYRLPRNTIEKIYKEKGFSCSYSK